MFLLKFGDIKIGFYKGRGEEKSNATLEENNEPIPWAQPFPLLKEREWQRRVVREMFWCLQHTASFSLLEALWERE